MIHSLSFSGPHVKTSRVTKSQFVFSSLCVFLAKWKQKSWKTLFLKSMDCNQLKFCVQVSVGWWTLKHQSTIFCLIGVFVGSLFLGRNLMHKVSTGCNRLKVTASLRQCINLEFSGMEKIRLVKLRNKL